MTRKRNAPALAKRESVECLLGGDIGVDNTIAARVQYLVRSGISINRAALLSSIAFGETAHG